MKKEGVTVAKSLTKLEDDVEMFVENAKEAAKILFSVTNNVKLLPGGERVLEVMDKHMMLLNYGKHTKSMYLNKMKKEVIPHFEAFYSQEDIPFIMDSLLWALESNVNMPYLNTYLQQVGKDASKAKVAIQAYKALCAAISDHVTLK